MGLMLTRDELARALVQAGQGDRSAFRAVYEATSAKLFGVCLRILPDRQTAEDVLQDTYVTVWRKAASFDASRASPITWLVTIARNRAIDRLRSAAPMRNAAPVEEAHDLADAGPLASETVEQADEATRLNGCLETLEDKARAVIRTAFFEGATYDELAKRENVPLGTMKSWIRRGLLRLRSCLEA
jgi:RNA polymerase sigma-70 factor (ECF subfamily)